MGVGDFSETDDLRPAYFIRPPDIPAVVEHTVGGISLAAVITTTVALACAWRREPPEPGWLSVLLPLLAVGVIAALAWRVMTAAVMGANIGAGMIVLFGTPVVIALIAFATISAWRRR